jgi:hypothetical protein
VERATTKEQQEIAKVQERSAIVFKITVALLTSGALGTVIAVVLPTADDSKTPLPWA